MMTWGKVSDELHDDEKWRAASKGARALWTTALSWAASKGNGGRVPKHMLAYLDGTAREAADLVRVGLWDADSDGWQFHDWDHYNESEEVAQARKQKRANAAAEANHVRWHVRKGVRIESCGLCFASDSDRSADSATESDRNPPGPGPGPVPEEVGLSEGEALPAGTWNPLPFCDQHMPGGPRGARCVACKDAGRAWEAAGRPTVSRPSPRVDAPCDHSKAIKQGLELCECDARLVHGVWQVAA